MQKKHLYFENLDVVRFFAFFSVLISHHYFFNFHFSNKYLEAFRQAFLENGDLGVTMFFVLSGFLITYLLLEEKEDKGTINIKYFYIRRVLRIWPLYFLNIVIGVLVISNLKDLAVVKLFDYEDLLSLKKINEWYYLVFVGNFDFGHSMGKRNVFIGILWSVCVEEQFYLMWPLVIRFLNRKKLVYLLFAIVLFATGYRYFIAKGSYGLIKYYTFSCISDLAIGSLCAYIGFHKLWICRKISNAPQVFFYLLYFSVTVLLVVRKFFYPTQIILFLGSIEPVVFSMLFGCIILEQNYASKSPFKLARLEYFRVLGRYTYFAYCFHYHVLLIVLVLFHAILGDRVQTPSIILIIVETVIACWLIFLLGKMSFTFFEQPFLDLKRRFAYIVKKEG